MRELLLKNPLLATPASDSAQLPATSVPQVMSAATAKKSLEHHTCTFDGLVASYHDLCQKQQQYENLGVLQAPGGPTLIRIRSLLANAMASDAGRQLSTDEIEQRLRQWDAAYNFRLQSNTEGAHPFLGRFAEAVLDLLAEAVAVKHPALSLFPDLGKEAVAAARADLGQRQAQAEQGSGTMPCYVIR